MDGEQGLGVLVQGMDKALLNAGLTVMEEKAEKPEKGPTERGARKVYSLATVHRAWDW